MQNLLLCHRHRNIDDLLDVLVHGTRLGDHYRNVNNLFVVLGHVDVNDALDVAVHGALLLLDNWDMHVLLLQHWNGNIDVMFHMRVHVAFLLHDLRHVHDLLHNHGDRHIHNLLDTAMLHSSLLDHLWDVDGLLDMIHHDLVDHLLLNYLLHRRDLHNMLLGLARHRLVLFDLDVLGRGFLRPRPPLQVLGGSHFMRVRCVRVMVNNGCLIMKFMCNGFALHLVDCALHSLHLLEDRLLHHGWCGVGQFLHHRWCNDSLPLHGRRRQIWDCWCNVDWRWCCV